MLGGCLFHLGIRADHNKILGVIPWSTDSDQKRRFGDVSSIAAIQLSISMPSSWRPKELGDADL